jgi:hypothetical protein
MRDLLREVELRVTILAKALHPEREAQSAPEDAPHLGWALVEIGW